MIVEVERSHYSELKSSISLKHFLSAWWSNRTGLMNPEPYVASALGFWALSVILANIVDNSYI